MADEKDEFFVVRKGDLIGVFNNLNDCQAQVGSTICDPPVSVYKGHSMRKDTAEYLASRTLVVLRVQHLQSEQLTSKMISLAHSFEQHNS
ncbi:unnamed protein product [Rhodiola kirilowii]